MWNHFKRAALTAALVLLLAACVAPASTTPPGSTVAVATPQATDNTGTETTTPTNAASPVEATGDMTLITLRGNTVDISGAGATPHDQGVLITAGGVYSLTGGLDDGMVLVDAPDQDVTLILNGVSILNQDGPAILFRASRTSTVTLAEATINTLEDGGEHDDHDATLWSSATLTINGTGELHVIGHYQEGIASEMHLNIDGGNIWVQAFDDGLNANNDNVSVITVNDGYLYVNGGGDGIDSNGALVVNGGTVIAMSALTDMNGGIDADGPVTINGGTVVATGARINMPVAESPQKSLALNYPGTQSGETLTAILDASSAPLLTFAPAVDYRQLLFSSPQITEGVTYTIYIGGTATGEALDGLYAASAYTPGTEVARVDTASLENLRGMAPGGPRP